MARTRVGVVGVGALGRHHARLYGTLPDAELVGVYDVAPGQAATVAAELGTRAYPDLDELVAACDALSVAVPTHRHAEMVTRLLNADRHVLVEKPLAATVAEGRALVALAKARGLTLQVGHVEQFNPVISFLEQHLRHPRFIESHRLAAFPPPRPGLPPRGTEVGVVLDLMIHDLDIILHLVNSPVTQVDAVGIPVLTPHEDIANARVSFANGCVANITASRVSPERMRKIRVFEPNAYLSLDYEKKQGEIHVLGPQGITCLPVPITDRNALAAELAVFVAAVAATRAGAPPPALGVDGERALRALEVACDITACIAERNTRFPAPPTR